MSTDDTYQGWTNRETWALMLHINNDRGLSEMFRELVNHTDFGDVAEVQLQVTTLLDPDEYRAEFDTSQPAEVARMASEVGSLWRVDWSEIYAALSED